MTGGMLVVVGAILCLAGVASIHLEVLGIGFAVGWLVAELFDASALTALIVGLVSAAVAWLVVKLVFRFTWFFLGAIGGAVVGAKLARLLAESDETILLRVAVVAMAALAGGLLARHLRQRALLWLTAAGGAALVLSGLARLAPDAVGFLRDPDRGWERAVATLAWVGLTLVGVAVQRRLFPRSLGLEPRRDGGVTTWS